MRKTEFSVSHIFDHDGEPFFTGKRSGPNRAAWFYGFVATLINGRLIQIDA